MMREHLLDACATQDTNLGLECSWQDLVMLDHADAQPGQRTPAMMQEQPTACQITSMQLSREPWLRTCVFVKYIIADSAGNAVKHDRVVLVLTPPPLEAPAGSIINARVQLPLAIASCCSCAAPIRRLGSLLRAWQWPAIAVVGTSWRSLVDCVQQKANAESFRDSVHAIICEL